MSIAIHELRALILAFSLLFISAIRLMATEPLLLVSQEPQEATFVAASVEGKLQFRVANELRSVASQELVRWSTPPSSVGRSELILGDGSRLVLADPWTGQPSWKLTEDTIIATTRLLGKVTFERQQVRAVVLRAPTMLRPRTQFIDKLLSSKGTTTSLLLNNGDQFSGELIGLVTSGQGEPQLEFLTPLTEKPFQVSEDRVAAIVFAPQEALPSAKLVVGLRDGSLLSAESLVADEKQMRVRLANGQELTSTNSRNISYLRSLTCKCVYLSDLDERDYRHVPYLDLAWPYHHDRNVLGGRLTVKRRTYEKGLGTHSASRLTYQLEPSRFHRFAAQVAIDDLAEQRGSVIFRVYLLRQGEWQLAYASPVLRGGDPPASVTVELGEAAQLALVTDFADRGDECDYANWLEARLE